MTQMFACMYSSGEGTARLLADRAFERGDVKWILRQTQFPRHESEQSHEVVRKSRFNAFSAVFLFLLQMCRGGGSFELRGVLKMGVGW
jgi:hypothetical protein